MAVLEEIERQTFAEQGPWLESVFAQFRDLMIWRGIPANYPRELLAGMRMDIDKMIYRTWEDLSLYCFRVAGVVGLMMCHIMSLRDETKLDKAVELGQAMQLTNICRDIKEDEEMGRCYIPQEVLDKHRIAQASTKTRSDRERLFPAVIDLLDRAEASYEEAWLGLPYLPFKASLCIAIAMELYRGIGKKI